MLFNSFEFAVFLPLVFLLYWALGRSFKAQNTLLLLASCWFYMAFVPVYILILALTITVDYAAGLLIERSTGRVRKRWLIASIIANVGVLSVFKYWGFLNQNLVVLLAPLGVSHALPELDILLPIGLSFHTFQSLAYTIEVYRGAQKAERRPGMFALYVMFFPQLVAGPIERPRNLLEQIEHPRRFDPQGAVDGLRQMLWGFFKKIVIADNCARVVADTFDGSGHLPGPVLLLGAMLFAFQIYCDFSGYSDIALGCARLLGFRLMRNFAFPYFSRDIAEFWRRWHISLSSWFRDYLYIPLGGGRGNMARRVRNMMIVFAVSGLWHGANWTYMVWGALNGLYFLPLLLRGRHRAHMDTIAEGRNLPSWPELRGMVTTFLLACIAWVFFRAATLGRAVEHLEGIALRSWSPGAWRGTARFLSERFELLPALGLLVLMVLIEWRQRRSQHALEVLPARRSVRWAIYIALLAAIVFVGDHGEQQFIYFQF
jgi:D-alanyl-lipoteichoic acid acyltransferase DltB (MBOAT superfamily)